MDISPDTSLADIDFRNHHIGEIIDFLQARIRAYPAFEMIHTQKLRESDEMLLQWLLRAKHFETAIHDARVAFADAEREIEESRHVG